jgi:hypothetical protein
MGVAGLLMVCLADDSIVLNLEHHTHKRKHPRILCGGKRMSVTFDCF